MEKKFQISSLTTRRTSA